LPTRKYRAAGGIVVDLRLGRVLVLARPGTLETDGAPEIRLPKGHIEPGETARQAALREVCEEAGLAGLAIVAELGQQIVQFDWQEERVVRRETYFLMTLLPGTRLGAPEEQFERLWLSWQDAEERITFEAEREWLRRARRVWSEGLEDIADEHPE
jgi:8-oxo-dGTP pyrophosphatase MutT (NUDIX family)